jgi:hypothetical protein
VDGEDENPRTPSEALQHNSNKKDGISLDSVEELEPLFIPLGWPKELPQTFYKGSDPEWQSFLAFNRDPKKAAALQRPCINPIS